MDYKSIYETLCKRGKKRRTKTACWDKMSVTKTKAYPVGPDGTVYQSIRQAAQVTGIKRSNIDNWIRREHYGWSKRLVGTGEV